MKNTFRVSILAAAIGASVGGSFIVPPAAAAAAAAQPADSRTWLIRFGEAGALHYHGGVAGLRATARAAGAKFDVHGAEVVAYRDYLGSLQARHATDIANALGRAPQVSHTYQLTHSGIAARLSDAEAAIVRALPGVTSVEPEPVYSLATFRGPTFIGADTVWNQTPPSATNRGRGIVVGVLDGGTNSTHPSFGNDASCGFSDAAPKLRSFRDCSGTDASGVCNGPDPEDHSLGHGVHTSSTAAGNVLTAGVNPAPEIPAPYTQMSGVAPCAAIRSYKVCPDEGCDGAAVQAAIENVLADGDVDVVNYSISGGLVPWSVADVDRNLLELVDGGIFVAAAAGNLGGDIVDPLGWANHRGPWMMSVAAVTHDAVPLAGLSVTGPEQPADLQQLALGQGSTTPLGDALVDRPLRDYPANRGGCSADGGFPAGTFDDAIAVVQRGICTFAEKITNAYNAGAVMVVIGNNQSGSFSMDTSGAPNVPAYSISSQAVADHLFAYIDAHPGSATASFDTNGRQGDRLAEFSLRGPLNPPFKDLAKPDVAAPGVRIYAAQNAANGNYGYMDGTSMASPHVAGAAALIRAQHPSWSPMAVKSALQTTAKSDGFREDGVSPWTVDDVGSGRIDVSRATRAGLVLEETTERFLSANPAGEHTLPVTELNLPALRDTACAAGCTFTRTLSSTLASAATWNVAFESGDLQGVRVEVEPAVFTIAPGATQQITVTVDMGTGAPVYSPLFGEIVLREASGQAPDEHLTFAVAGTRHGDRLFASGFDGAGDDVVRVDGLDYEFPVDYPWGAVDWLSGGTCHCNTAPYPFTVWMNAGAIAFDYPATPGGDGTYGAVAAVEGGFERYLVLQTGDVVGPDSNFGTIGSSLGPTHWMEGADGYLGFRFWNVETNQVNYGYAHLVSTAPTGYPITLKGYAFDRTGKAVTIP